MIVGSVFTLGTAVATRGVPGFVICALLVLSPPEPSEVSAGIHAYGAAMYLVSIGTALGVRVSACGSSAALTIARA